MITIPENKLLTIYTDGASRGNPGPSAYGFIFLIGEKIIHQKSSFIGDQTNNQAEYRAMIEALSEARKMTRGKVELFSDSELVINQINGIYQVKKSHLQILWDQVVELKSEFLEVKLTVIPRDNKWIKQVDKLCNRSLNLKK
ncbi:MAG: ribonuclease HI family protein [Candidatus Hodarchaeales archaeon]